MGLLVMMPGLVLFLGTHLVATRRDLRARLIARSARAATRSLIRCFRRRRRADRLGICALSRHRLDRRLVSAA